MFMKIRENFLLSGESLYRFLPHRPPVFLVDRYYGRDQEASYTGYIPETGSLFCPDDVFLEEGLIEHMAQSVALAAGVENVERGNGIVPGYIGSVSSLTIHGIIGAGDSLYTAISEIHKFPSFSVILAKTFIRGIMIAQGELMVVRFNEAGA
jgi:predicted hotdog family 3-hydroxylacyl-ACP dehydratase